MKNVNHDAGNLSSDRASQRKGRTVAPKKNDSAFDIGTLHADMKWVKSHLQSVEGEAEKTRQSIAETKSQLSTELKTVAGSLAKSIDSLADEFRADILARAQQATGEAGDEADKDKIANDRFHTIERKHAVLAAVVFFILALIGGKVAIPWAV